jgi:hypothetical protein
MSVTEYKYQKATHAQLLKCLKWCRNQFQLRDWELTLETGEYPPEEARECGITKEDIGCSHSSLNKLRAAIWINMPLCKRGDYNPISVAIHEANHVFMRARLSDDDDNHEGAVRILEPMLYRLYCRENGLKIMSEKS